MIRIIKNLLRPTWRKAYKFYDKKYRDYKAFEVPIEKLLRGGENGIRSGKWAEITGDFLRPSTPIREGHHTKLLQLYDKIGDKIFEDKIFKETDYYKNACESIRLTGSYFYDRPDQIKTLAERFIAQHKGEQLDLPKQPGQSDADQPIWVRPIRDSTYYEVIDGNHRIARAIMRGDQTIKALVYYEEAHHTPLQRLLLDVLWINHKKWLYQPVESSEIKDQWILVRKCEDRLQMMKDFLKEKALVDKPGSYFDIASSYGWFVNEFSKMRFDAYGMERDCMAIDVGEKVYGLPKEKVMNQEVSLGLATLVKEKKKYDVVSLLSILHHFVLHKNSVTAEELIQLVDKVTGKVLFLDTGEAQEPAFVDLLPDWDQEFIQDWIKKHTSFTKVIPLGVDNDRKKPFETYYNRMLFACVREN